jgi:putative transposase
LSALGQLIQRCWLKIPELNDHIELDEFVLMPNHLHGILRFEKSVVAQESTPKFRSHRINLTTPGSLPTVIRSFKAAVTKISQRELQIQRIWQRGYFEHVVRTEDALFKIRQYIQDNPTKWDLDELNPLE